MSRYILDQGLADTEFLNRWTNGLEEYRKSLAPFTLEFASETSGVPVDMLKQVAHMIADADRVLRSMGDGHNPAHPRVHCNFESVAGYR